MKRNFLIGLITIFVLILLGLSMYIAIEFFKGITLPERIVLRDISTNITKFDLFNESTLVKAYHGNRGGYDLDVNATFKLSPNEAVKVTSVVGLFVSCRDKQEDTDCSAGDWRRYNSIEDNINENPDTLNSSEVYCSAIISRISNTTYRSLCIDKKSGVAWYRVFIP